VILLQALPLFALIAYMLYMIYYFIIPTAYLRIMLYCAHKKYCGIDIRFADNWVLVKLPEYEKPIGRLIDIDIPARLLEYTVCSELRELLREVRKRAAS